MLLDTVLRANSSLRSNFWIANGSVLCDHNDADSGEVTRLEDGFVVATNDGAAAELARFCVARRADDEVSRIPGNYESFL